MADLYITECSEMGAVLAGGMLVPVIDARAITAQQNITIGVASVASAAFNANTNYIRVQAEAACHINFDVDADGTTIRLALDATEYWAVPVGGTIEVIQD